MEFDAGKILPEVEAEKSQREANVGRITSLSLSIYMINHDHVYVKEQRYV